MSIQLMLMQIYIYYVVLYFTNLIIHIPPVYDNAIINYNITTTLWSASFTIFTVYYKRVNIIGGYIVNNQ